MTATTAHNDISADKEPTETVVSSKLREGDRILNNGCLMQLGPIKSSPDSVNKNASGPVTWARGYILERFNETIPTGWLETAEDGRKYWTIQGNDRATWRRIVVPEAGA